MLKKRIITIWVFALLMVTVAEAQTVFSGRVADAEGKAVARASVMLRGEKGRTVAFGTTNSEGRFSVKLPEGRVAKDVAVNHIGFAQVVIAIDKFKNGQTITMRDKPVEIREVTVKPEEIRLEGDTLTYNVAGFKQKQDKYIEDVIARLPGVSVTPQGKIMYQGKEINKFYVEGMDLMGSKYAQVSRNLTADKVKNVQVYENHQPVKMQRGVTFSEQAAMNLQLKDEAKNVWTGVIDAGTGLTLQGKTDWLRDGRWVEMIFGRKKQSLSMYKTNNTGKDITMEVRTAGTATQGLLNNLTNRSGERSTFDDTHIVATNWLFKTKEDATLRLQVAGLRDRIKTQSYSETRYNDVEGQVLMTEEQSRTARQDQWNAELQYHLNASKVNLQNILTGYADFDRGYGTSLLNGVSTPLAVRPRHRSIKDELQLGWMMKNRNYMNIRLQADYSYLPCTLLLVDGSEERLDMKVMNFAASTTFTQRLGKKLSLSYNVGERSRVEMMDVAYATTQGHDRYGEHRVYVYPSLSYFAKRLHFSIEPKMNLLFRSIGDRHDNRFYVDPSASISYEMKGGLTAMAMYRFSYMASGSLSSLTHVPYYSSYNYLSQGIGDFTHSTSHNVSGGLNYRHTPSNLFAHFGFNGDFSKRDLYSSHLEGGTYSRQLTGRMQHTQNYGLNASVSKRFFFWMANVSLSGSHSWNHFNVMLGDEVSPVTNRSANVSGSISVNPITLMSAELSSSLMMSWQDRKMVASGQTSFRNYSHRASIFFFPGKWQLGLKAEYAHSTDKRQSSNFFGDASVVYRTKTFDAGIYLNNIFGTYEQRRRTITELAEFYRVTYMRPRELMVKVSFNL